MPDIRTVLVDGDPFKPSSLDLVSQLVSLPLGEMPPGNGWSILTGNPQTNLWGRIAYRRDAALEAEIRGELFHD